MSSHVLSKENVTHIIRYLREQDDSDLASLVASLESQIETIPHHNISTISYPTRYNYESHIQNGHAHCVTRTSNLILNFDTGEHNDQEVRIPGRNNNWVILPNGIKMTYGEIVALGGDFYGIPESPICEEVNNSSYKRFMDSFNTLARADPTKIRKEVAQIRAILAIEMNSVATVLGQGDPSVPTVLDQSHIYKQPSDVYKYHGLYFTIRYDTILGGTWNETAGVPIRFGRMMNLAENNRDHFQPYSTSVWEAGHRLALDKAKEARIMFHDSQQKAIELLDEAYAISAFSCHFLTDSFSAGHIRVPRVELPAVVTPSRVGHLLAKDHHDEDCKFGLNVINRAGERWMCHGDGTLYDERSKENKMRVRSIVQECVDQIHGEFRRNKSQALSMSAEIFNKITEVDWCAGIINKIPEVDSTRPNNFPLFRAVRNQKGQLLVLRRKDINDLSDPTETNSWWGCSTWSILQKYDPKNSRVCEPHPYAECVECKIVLKDFKLTDEHYKKEHNGTWRNIILSICQHCGERFNDGRPSVNEHIRTEHGIQPQHPELLALALALASYFYFYL